jgi:hypothetical protein
MDPRTLRLFDLQPHHSVTVRCQCGRVIEFLSGTLQRWYRLPSDTLVYDLQYRLRCRHCNRRDGFTIAVVDRDARAASSDRDAGETVIAKGEDR